MNNRTDSSPPEKMVRDLLNNALQSFNKLISHEIMDEVIGNAATDGFYFLMYAIRPRSLWTALFVMGTTVVILSVSTRSNRRFWRLAKILTVPFLFLLLIWQIVPDTWPAGIRFLLLWITSPLPLIVLLHYIRTNYLAFGLSSFRQALLPVVCSTVISTSFAGVPQLVHFPKAGPPLNERVVEFSAAGEWVRPVAKDQRATPSFTAPAPLVTATPTFALPSASPTLAYPTSQPARLAHCYHLDQSIPRCSTYQVVANDFLSCVAERASVPFEALRLANPQIIDPNQIWPGQEVSIPCVGPGKEE